MIFQDLDNVKFEDGKYIEMCPGCKKEIIILDEFVFCKCSKKRTVLFATPEWLDLILRGWKCVRIVGTNVKGTVMEMHKREQ